MGDSSSWSRSPNRRHGKAALTPICFLMVHFSFLKCICLPTHVSHLPEHPYEEVICILVHASFSAPSRQMVHKPRVLSNLWKDISHESPPKCMNFLTKKSVFSDKTIFCHSNSHVPNYNPGRWKRASWQNCGDLGLLSTRTRQSGKRRPGNETYEWREASSGLRWLLTQPPPVRQSPA